MIIRTSQERNLVGCCCPILECGEPRLEVPLPDCCIAPPFESGGDFSGMGLPEGFDDLCFQYIERTWSQTQQTVGAIIMQDGYETTRSRLQNEITYAKHDVPFEDVLPDSCTLRRVARTYDYSVEETSNAIPGEGVPSYYTISTAEEHTSGTTGGCTGTYTEYTESFRASGTDPGTTSTVASFECDDLFTMEILEDFVYTNEGGGVHIFTKTTETGSLETELITTTEEIRLTTWRGDYYKFCVPEDYSTFDAPRSVWDMQWDVGFFTSLWLDWYEGGQLGDEPIPVPHRQEQNDWVWGGSMSEPCSDVYLLPLPLDFGFEDVPELDIHWEARRLNIMVVCWRSSAIGVKPTAHGMQYDWPYE